MLRRFFSSGRLVARFPGIVSSRSLFAETHLLEPSKVHPEQRLEPKLRAEKQVNFRYESIHEHLRLDPEFRTHLSPRTDRIQEYLGSQFPLEFNELLSIVCGLGTDDIKLNSPQKGRNRVEIHMEFVAEGSESSDLSDLDEFSVEFKSPSTQSPFPSISVNQETLRDLGRRFFDFQCQMSLIFADPAHLESAPKELEYYVDLFKHKDRLIWQFMTENALVDCVIPYRGVHSAGPITDAQIAHIGTHIKKKTCIGSFYTILGLLLRKFGSDHVLEHYWTPKMLHPQSGIVALATANAKNA